MKEILFKAKRTDNGEWVEGYYCKIKTAYYDNIGLFHEEYKDCISVSASSGGITWFYVDPSTLCQYTGLHDRTKWEELSEKEQRQFLSEWNYEKDRKNQKEDWNGKKIWENDIVKHDFGSDQIGVQYAIVKYDSKYAGYLIKPIQDWMYCDKSDCEVIGNIFDKPELLDYLRR